LNCKGAEASPSLSGFHQLGGGGGRGEAPIMKNGWHLSDTDGKDDC